ncbi:uncharacterized protein LOC102360780 isoform X2 [Latimeria chalumnae]|uniref:uncharacterized protein LOC102360780 isoform X2 n=1 Tax=Latimeria chalumnae TaxID=7897 RepID=UPI0003C166F0|nr:PREDICTED: uncharacterized protein LOC102360780 isoform X2 [Latimeria chalumnae]|eukprot:XP_005986799.1 PREDICTED: uncharacterized protein LOC102360780 isoform X2 [Latimeria chalumnae]
MMDPENLDAVEKEKSLAMSPENDKIEEVACTMIWSLEEAAEKQTSQIGVSACGATAVLNVLQALGISVTPEIADRCVRTKIRQNDASLPEYLMSRSVAGATHEQLIEGAEKSSSGEVVGKFFSFYPERNVSLTKWLATWIQKGAIPVATMNMQLAVPESEEIPDAWHHQMIFGVGPEGIYLTNPLEVEKASIVKQRLCSDSVLLICREDILMRLSEDTKLSALAQVQDDPRWEQLDVAGQVGQMIYEEITPDEGANAAHVAIPAAYKSGITLFALKDSELAKEILNAEELPLCP